MSVTNLAGSRDSDTRRDAVLLTSLRVVALLSVINVVVQGVTAGEILMHNHTAFKLHEAGAIVIHVLTGLAAILAAVIWYTTKKGLWSTVIAAVVFIATFVQAALGHAPTMFIHVPLAILITVGAMWVLTHSWRTLR
jgi:uncharacterized membrane protein